MAKNTKRTLPSSPPATCIDNTDGVGIKQGTNIAVGIGGSRCGFVAYEIRPDGLEGIWGGYGTDKTGTEKATKQ